MEDEDKSILRTIEYEFEGGKVIWILLDDHAPDYIVNVLIKNRGVFKNEVTSKQPTVNNARKFLEQCLDK